VPTAVDLSGPFSIICRSFDINVTMKRPLL
jgi:hypothetical protein